jgi:hypothetical protein
MYIIGKHIQNLSSILLPVCPQYQCKHIISSHKISL